MDTAISKAFEKNPRSHFLPEQVRYLAALDQALPIGYGQTNSQPSTVEKMLRWLEPKAKHTVLDVGSGSGWTTALLATVVGDEGHVFAVERIAELVKIGRDNCKSQHISNVSFHMATQHFGLPEHAPYNRILVSAGAETLPTELLNQLKSGGKLVVPVGNDILEISKTSQDSIRTIVHSGYIFVPLLKSDAK